MRKRLALAGVLACTVGLVIAARFILIPQPGAGALPASTAEVNALPGDGPQKGSASASQQESNKGEKGAGFRYPDDNGGKLLSKLLAPSAPPVDDRPTKKSTQGPAAIEHPTLPPPRIVAALPRLPDDPPVRKLQPGPVPEEQPFGQHYDHVALPSVPSFSTGELIRTPSIDISKPIPLPVMGRPLSDRATLEDPTLEPSKEAVLSATMPARTAPAPYFRIDLPDPFEFRDAVQSKVTVEEDPMPISSTPRPPR